MRRVASAPLLPSRPPRSPQHEKLAQLGETIAQPTPVLIGHPHHTRGHRDQVVALELRKCCRLDVSDAGCGKQDRHGYAEDRGKARKDRGPRLLDPSGLELCDRGARNTHALRELGLREVRALPGGAHRQRERRAIARGGYVSDAITMSVKASTLTLCQYTDKDVLLPHSVPSISMALGADHRAPANETDVVLLLAIPALWIAGVVLLIVRKFRVR